jgi:hypothetical protein
MSLTISLIKNITIERYAATPFSTLMVGQLSFTKIIDLTSQSVSIKCTNLTTGLTQTILVPAVDDVVDSIVILLFDQMGFRITCQAVVDSTCLLFVTYLDRSVIIADSICNDSTDIHIRAALPIDITIPFNTDVLLAKADANLSFGDYSGWVLYREPTQDELSADTSAPNNVWQPYFGDASDIRSLTTTLIPKISSDRSAPLLLSDGTPIYKYSYSWGDYSIMTDKIIHKKYDGTDSSVEFVLNTETTIDSTRLTVYLNGIFKDSSAVNISKNVVSCVSMNPSLGDTITVVHKAYVPSKKDLSFDPDADPSADTPAKNTQYKYDYQYTSREIRNDAGQLTNTFYYFWVANKNLTTNNRTMSIQSAKNLLKVNTDPYVILQNASIGTSNLPQYNQVIGMGLNRYITEDDMYKIRFTRDFILRDDPHNVTLKNIHTEWATIRESQATLIPEKLWNALVDAASGLNIIGDPVPSLGRVAYDERTGSNTRFGFGVGQALVDKTFAVSSIKYSILNTSVVTSSPANPGVEIQDPISFIDPSTIDAAFATPKSTRKILNDIWMKAKPRQVNEIFFTVLYDALSENYEFTDIFKTSMIAAHSIRMFSNIGGTNP